MSAPSYDAVVIGAGVIGTAVTYELAQRGWRVVGVDRNPGAGQGSTSSSSAIVRFTYSTRAGVAMSYEGLQYWLNWPAHIGDCDEAAQSDDEGDQETGVDHQMGRPQEVLSARHDAGDKVLAQVPVTAKDVELRADTNQECERKGKTARSCDSHVFSGPTAAVGQL